MKTNKRKKALKRYARDFCDKVKEQYPKVINTGKYPIIKCYVKKGIAETERIIEEAQDIVEPYNDKMVFIDGFCNIEDGSIEIFNIFKEKPEALKRTIRHECLHFLLYESGQPWDDNDNIFLLLALYYDAQPYGLYKAIIEHEERGTAWKQ